MKIFKHFKMEQAAAAEAVPAATPVAEPAAEPEVAIAAAVEPEPEVAIAAAVEPEAAPATEPEVAIAAAVEEEEFEVEHGENSPLSSEQFNAVVDFAEKTGLNEEQTKAVLKMNEDHALAAASTIYSKKVAEDKENYNKVINDPEFGGAKFSESLKIMALPVQQFGDDDFKALVKSELGNQPAFARFIYKLGNAMKSEGFVGKGGSTKVEEVSVLQKMYPDFYKES